VAKKRRQRLCWYDVEQALKLLLGLANEIVKLIKAIHGG
jgi:hypothetical protein